MLFNLSLLCIFTVSVNSNLRTDCYASFSEPVIYIKLSHYFPCGPLSLYGHFSYVRFSILEGHFSKRAKAELHFKRIDDDCTPSVIFTTLGKDLKELNAIIWISLYESYRKLSAIKYTFYRGFKSGIYKMLDETQNFAVHVKVVDVAENYLNITNYTNKREIYSYRRSISGKSNEICVITENNPAIILKPIHNSNTHNDYIIRIQAKIYESGKPGGDIEFLAFECNRDDEYIEKHVIFITDNDSTHIEFYIIYFELEKTRFEIQHLKFEYAYKLQNFHQPYGKFFLLKSRLEHTKCSDKSKSRIYVSNFNVILYGEYHKEIHISSSVKFFTMSFTSPLDLCIQKKLK